MASHSTVQVHGADLWVKVGRDMWIIVLKFRAFNGRSKKGKKTDLNQSRSVGTSSSAQLYLRVRSRAPSVCTSVLNPKRPSDCNSGDPVKQSAMPLEQLKGIVRMFASV